MAKLRSICAMSMPDITPSTGVTVEPKFIEVDPLSLLVDESYQRNLSERSVNLIRRIVAGWDWRAYKPPVVTKTDGGWHILDGQHTAIAAATHPAIGLIPVMVVEAETQQDRAGAFVKHNRDRIAATPTQLHYALVAAGDEDALTIQQACERAGARVLKNPPGDGRWQPGDTVAVSSLRGIAARRHAKGLREVLSVCADAALTPISADAVKAVEELLFGEAYRGQVLPADLSTTMREMGAVAEKEASRFAAEHDLSRWKGLVVVWFRNCRKVRRGLRTAA